MNTTYTFKQTFLASLLAGAGTAVICLLWRSIHEAITGFSVPQIVHTMGITMSSFLPLIVAGIIFYFLQKLGAKGRTGYIIGTVVLALLSLWGTFNQPMPDGSATPAAFTLLTLPMHFVSMVGALLIPRLAPRINP
jgi:apolipoprotein N-acyltransferase